MPNNRAAERKRTFLPARIEVGRIGVALSCTIRDLSDTGARLQVAGSDTLPQTFRLHIPKFDRTVTAEQRWRRGDFIGVNFVSAVADKQAPSDEGRREYVQKLEAELKRLKLQLAEIREDPSRAMSLSARYSA